jgi:hypothetical protein
MLLQERLAQAKRSVRVYSQAGFVPRSYRWPCPIEYIEARKNAEGLWEMRVGISDAKRAHGKGALVVVDGRGVS